jgi:DNA-binding MarR family transcriptional regulator
MLLESENNLDAFGAIRQANRAITQLYDLALAPARMKASQFMMLRIIDAAGEVAQCTIARQHAVSVETLSRRFAALRRKGLVATRIGAHCERIYSLTEKGKAALNDARPYWENAQARLRESLGGQDWQHLFELCTRTLRAAREAEQLRRPNGHPIRVPDSLPRRSTDRAAA